MTENTLKYMLWLAQVSVQLLLRRRIGECALIAQLGERQTEDLKVSCSIHDQGSMCPDSVAEWLRR